MVNYLKSIHSTHLYYIPIIGSGTLLHSGDLGVKNNNKKIPALRNSEPNGEGQKQVTKDKQNNQILINAMKDEQSCVTDNKGKMGNHFN